MPVRSRRWLVAGLVLLVAGAASLAAVVVLGGDDDGERPVGKLIDQTGLAAAPADVDEASTPSSSPFPTELTPTTLPDGALPTGCGPWDPAFGFAPEPIEGVALWSDFDGWHVRLGPGGPASITGSVIGQGVPVLTTDPLPEGVDVTEDLEGKALRFSITAASEPIGFDLGASCGQKQLTFELVGPDGAPVGAADVQVGQAATAPSVPVIAQRTSPAPG